MRNRNNPTYLLLSKLLNSLKQGTRSLFQTLTERKHPSHKTVISCIVNRQHWSRWQALSNHPQISQDISIYTNWFGALIKICFTWKRKKKKICKLDEPQNIVLLFFIIFIDSFFLSFENVSVSLSYFKGEM